MKKYFALAVICLLAGGMDGCKKNDRQLFDPAHMALNIWVGTASMPYETVTYNFMTRPDVDQVMFHVRVAGGVADFPRTFTLEAVEGDIDKVTFTYDDYVIPAGEYQMSFPIHIEKPANYEEFTDTQGYIIFRMTENSTFAQGAESANGIELNRLHVIFKNNLDKPDNWDAENDTNFRPILNYFGSYSKVKYSFILKTLGEWFVDVRIKANDTLTGQPENVIGPTKTAFYVNKCKIALLEFNNDPANIASGDAPLTDEFDEAVIF